MEVYTTGEVAKICQVAPRTVATWVDSGQLKGFRLPGRQDRRIPRRYLLKFMTENKMPLSLVDELDPQHLLIVTSDDALTSQLMSQLSKTIETISVITSFEAGIQLAARRPLMLIVDFPNGIGGAYNLCQRMLSPGIFQAPVIVAIAENQHAAQLREMGIADVISRPFDPALLVERMKTLMKQRSM